MVVAGLWVFSIVATFVATLFIVKRNPKIMSVIGAYDQLVNKIKSV